MAGQPYDSEHQPNRRDGLANPEQEHPFDEAGFERRHARLQATLERLERGIEAPEVQLVELSQLGSVRGVQLVKPVHELVDDGVPEQVDPGDSLRYARPVLGINSTRHGAFRLLMA